MDTKLEEKFLMMQVFIKDNKKDTDEKLKETDAKIDKIDKWTENNMDKFDNPCTHHQTR